MDSNKKISVRLTKYVSDLISDSSECTRELTNMIRGEVANNNLSGSASLNRHGLFHFKAESVDSTGLFYMPGSTNILVNVWHDLESGL